MLIHDSKGKVSIPGDNIDLLKAVIGPVNLLLHGKALGQEGQKISTGLSAYQKGDVVQIVDKHNFKYSGLYEIVGIDLSSTGNIQVFKLGFKRR